MSDIYSSFVLLGYVTIVHLFLVNIVLGIAIFIPILEYIYLKRKDNDIKEIAKRMFKVMVVIDLFAGVWATWITIFLGGFWPLLTFYATTVLFIPITISLIGILISLPSIGVYWFTWEKISEKLHFLIGIAIAIGATMVPIGFNMIFSFINDPVGLNQALQNNDLYAVFANPLYPEFTLHRIFGALTLVSLLYTGIFLYRYWKTGQEVYRKGAGIFIIASLPIILVESILGAIYAMELNINSQYIASSVLGPFYSQNYSGSLFPVFLVFMILVFLLWVILFYLLYAYNKNLKSIKLSLSLSILSLVTLPLGEFINDYSRYPYFIVTGNTGIPASDFFNNIMNISTGWVIVSVVVSVILAGIFSYYLYHILLKEKYSE